MELIAITGKRGHGKTTAAQFLEGRGYRHTNFADGVKEVCELVYGIPMAVLQDPVLKEQMLDGYPNATPREVMQHVGTEMFRAYRDDTWVEMFKRRTSAFSHVVSSDLRFPNEADAVRELGGIIIKVIDPRKPRYVAPTGWRKAWEGLLIKLRITAPDPGAHPSETAIDLIDADIEIINDGTIADLHAKLKAIL